MVIELLASIRGHLAKLLRARNCFSDFYTAQVVSRATKRRAANSRPSSFLGLLEAPVCPDVNGECALVVNADYNSPSYCLISKCYQRSQN